ncbi:peptidase inhibitor family I36 protein [Streptomyces sp. NPDC003247]|uniref:peptidase inhibitor family I36 protein n=1 Tax=Streptomyces sp. NPDC003247 TaxID=3364677 RepID=UPI0036BB128A
MLPGPAGEHTHDAGFSGGRGAEVYAIGRRELGHFRAWNDRVSSVWNLSGGQVCIWTDADYYGYYFSIPAGAKQELLFLYDNAVSSISVSGCGG